MQSAAAAMQLLLTGQQLLPSAKVRFNCLLQEMKLVKAGWPQS
jgi:hypothetical protein